MRKNVSNGLRKAYWCLTQWGFDPRRTIGALSGLTFYLRDYVAFRRGYRGVMRVMPSLHDRSAAAGAASSEYFQQDLYVAQQVFAANPARHVDVGSRVDGFVAHVASFREVEVMDIRPLPEAIPSVRFVQADMMAESIPHRDYCDSLSCLHALEHFGLGRYGDPISPGGHEAGLRNLAALLRPRGRLYLSVPIGRERVEFNSHRILSPKTVLRLASGAGLALSSFAWVIPGNPLEVDTQPDATLERLCEVDYALGIFTFDKS
jgi:hypothetical protein